MGTTGTFSREIFIVHLNAYWCGRGDSNSHGGTRWCLKPVRLPIPPRPPVEHQSDFQLNPNPRQLGYTFAKRKSIYYSDIFFNGLGEESFCHRLASLQKSRRSSEIEADLKGIGATWMAVASLNTSL